MNKFLYLTLLTNLLAVGCSSTYEKPPMPNSGSWQIINPEGYIPPDTKIYTRSSAIGNTIANGQLISDPAPVVAENFIVVIEPATIKLEAKPEAIEPAVINSTVIEPNNPYQPLSTRNLYNAPTKVQARPVMTRSLPSSLEPATDNATFAPTAVLTLPSVSTQDSNDQPYEFVINPNSINKTPQVIVVPVDTIPNEGLQPSDMPKVPSNLDNEPFGLPNP